MRSLKTAIIAAVGSLTILNIVGCSTSIGPGQQVGIHPYANRNYRTRQGSISQYEVASWYGTRFAGRPTSSGERFNPNDLTAASRRWPIGSRVRVTNPETGKSVVVRVNDSGPWIPGRSLDLSRHAAERIGLTSKGVGRVEVETTNSARPQLSLTSRPLAHDRPRAQISHAGDFAFGHKVPRASRRSTRLNPIRSWLAKLKQSWSRLQRPRMERTEEARAERRSIRFQPRRPLLQ